jgi:hypothetical protein
LSFWFQESSSVLFLSVLHILINMSMFSGLANQITGFVGSKMGQGEQPPADPNDPNAQMQDPNAAYAQNGADPNADPNAQAQGGGGMMGMAQGFLGKAMAAKDGLKEKASAFQPPALGGAAGGMMGNVMSMIPGQKREEEVPDPNAQMVDPNAVADPNAYVDPNAGYAVDPATGQYYDPNAYAQQ